MKFFLRLEVYVGLMDGYKDINYSPTQFEKIIENSKLKELLFSMTKITGWESGIKEESMKLEIKLHSIKSKNLISFANI